MTSENQQGPREAEFLRAWLSSRDVPCPVCGYNLRSIQATRCAECGAKLDLHVGSTELRSGLWLVGVISLTLPAAFIGLFAIFALPMVLSGASSPAPLGFFIFVTLMSIGYALLLGLLIRRRKKFWSKPRKAQIVGVVLCLLAGSAPLTVPIAIWLVGALSQ